MGDVDGPEVARMVYEELTKEDVLRLDTIPFALDAVLVKLRRSGVPPHRRATFIHIGA